MIGIKRVLLLATSFLLVCSVMGSTDDGALSQRKLAKGDDTSMDMDADTAVASKGKGKGKDDSSESKGSSEDSETTVSSKGGKGGKGSKSSSSSSSSKDGDDGTMPPTEGGKGKGDSKESSKGSKKGKGGSKGSKKASKKSKKSKKGGTNAPAVPTDPPSPPTAVTPSPTSANSISIRATPYALFYAIGEDRIPSTAEYAELAELTRHYLEEFMTDEFSQTALTNLDDFLTFMIRNAYTVGQPVQADYRSTGLFNPSSIFLPTVRELNEFITTAFSDDNLSEYVGRVQALPGSNVFSTTASITKELPSVPTPRNSSERTGGSGFVKAGVAAAAAGIVVLAAGLLLTRRRRGDELEDYGEKYGQNLKGDATVAGETCNMSLDGSTWRKDSPYAEDEDEDEFEDEPLDSDDEREADAQRHSSPKAPPQAVFSS